MTAVFPMGSEAHPAARRAALTLYAINEPDCELLIGQLPAEFRVQLQQMLAELGQLGLPRDASLVRAVLHEGETTARPSLSEVELASLAALLEREPPALSVQAVGLLTADDRSELLAHASHRLRRQLEELPPVVADPESALSRALVAELTARLPRRQPLPRWRRAWAAVRRRRTGA
jgi:hypothetical protein